METINLEGDWTVRSTDDRYELVARMPGSLFDALERRGDFGPRGLFHRENNRLCAEIADRDFLFARTFTVPPHFLRGPDRRIWLEADGLDTLAIIRVNGTDVGRAANMHRRWRFEVTGLLVPGENRIEILFANALAYVRQRHARRNLWHSYWGQPDIAYPGFNTIRKSHCSFGWDWGPIVPDVGIWRDIRLAAYDGARIAGVRVRQGHHDGRVELGIAPELEVWGSGRFRLEATLIHPDGGAQSLELALDGGEGCLEVEHPQLWWPNGLGGEGPRPLYRLETKLLGERSLAQSLDLHIGLRTLTVRRERDQWGEGFAFEVNGIPIFARGADYIPEDVALPRVTRARTERLLADAARASFNCLRVWGGGVYPSDDFYDLCDRYGLIVWQDLMFACALYDMDDPDFVGDISAEVRDNLARIRHHASLGLVCGNNEMEWGFEEWGFPHTKHNRTEYLTQYQVLFPAIVRQAAPDVFYWPASPSSGGDFEAPNSADRGDCHFWDVWHKNLDYSEYKKHFFRFMSEFGFESLPSLKTIRSFAEPEDLDLFSPVMEDHQRCVGGNAKILAYIGRYFRYPKDFEALVYVSQLSQADALRHGIEHWRRNRGRCMGAIYWQLNDNWPVISWSSIDYYGRWKALHYVAARAYDPLLVSADGQGLHVALHLSNETEKPVRGMLSWRLVRLDGELAEQGEAWVEAPAFSSREVASLDFAGLAQGQHAPPALREKIFAREHLLFFRFEERDGRRLRWGVHNFAPYKALSLREPGITSELSREQDRIVVRLASRRPALFVELDLAEEDRVFSDNYFALDGSEERVVSFEAGSLSLEEARAQLRVRSLYDSTARPQPARQ